MSVENRIQLSRFDAIIPSFLGRSSSQQMLQVAREALNNNNVWELGEIQSQIDAKLTNRGLIRRILTATIPIFWLYHSRVQGNLKDVQSEIKERISELTERYSGCDEEQRTSPDGSDVEFDMFDDESDIEEELRTDEEKIALAENRIKDFDLQKIMGRVQVLGSHSKDFEIFEDEDILRDVVIAMLAERPELFNTEKKLAMGAYLIILLGHGMGNEIPGYYEDSCTPPCLDFENGTSWIAIRAGFSRQDLEALDEFFEEVIEQIESDNSCI